MKIRQVEAELLRAVRETKLIVVFRSCVEAP